MKKDSAKRLIEVQRLPNHDGIEVNLERPDYSTYRLGSDHDLTKLLSDLDDRKDFLLITPFRGLNTETSQRTVRSWTENHEAFLDLLKEMRAVVKTHWVSAYWLIGHWADPVPAHTDGSLDDMNDRVEFSWLFILHDDHEVTGEPWIGVATYLAEAYSCGPFIVRTGGASLVRSECGHFLWPMENSDVEPTWALLARMRELGVDRDLQPPQTAEKLFEVGQAIYSARKTGGDENLPSPYAVRGVGQTFPCRFFAAEPHAISSSMMFQYLRIAHPPLRKWSR